VLAWEPPKRFVMTWHPGREADGAQELELRFAAVPGGTRVELEHRGWQALGERARETRDAYDDDARGWPSVLARYQQACRS
jgi:hypothetical protein